MMRESRQKVVFGGGRLGTVSVGDPAKKQNTTSREELGQVWQFGKPWMINSPM